MLLRLSLPYMRFILVLLLVFWGWSLQAQRFLKGTVVDEKGVAIPYAKLYVKNDASLRTVYRPCPVCPA